jgi:putative flippase GtrA
VSLVGAALQWSVFVALNAAFAWMLGAGASRGGGGTGIMAAIASPPDVGRWIYLSQLAGIAVATLWNFTANFFWTWRRVKGGPDRV